MADVIGLFCSSSYLLTSLNSSLHPVILPNQSLIRKVSRVSNSGSVSAIGGVVHAVLGRPRKELGLFKVQAAVAEATDQPKWWEKNAPNMIDIHSTEEFLSALSEALDRLVIVEFYGTWCASCRALFPKLCRTAEEHPEILFLKVNFDENKQMCKSMNVKVLPYFHFYRGADGQVDAFSCSLAKFQKIKDAIELHNLKQSSNDPQKVNNSNSQPL